MILFSDIYRSRVPGVHCLLCLDTIEATKSASREPLPLPTLIGALNEGPLHESLKQLYAEPGDSIEARIGKYIADILRGDRIIEIQTGAFGPLKSKLHAVLNDYKVTLVHPIACERWIVKLPKTPSGKEVRRKSPKRGRIEDVFEKLVSIADLLAHPGFELEVVAIQEEEVRAFDAGRSHKRRGWIVVERRLIQILNRLVVRTPDDLLSMIPGELPQCFSTLDIAKALGRPRWLAQMVAYCLRESGAVSVVGKEGNSIIYRV